MPLKTQFIRQFAALITQVGTEAPLATTLHNTFNETPTFARISAGTYTLTFPTVTFDAELTTGYVSNNRGPEYAFRAYWSATNQITLQSWIITAGEPTGDDDIFSATPIEIKLYYIPTPTTIPFVYPTSES